MATPKILPRPEDKQSVFLAQAVNYETVERFVDVIANMANHSGRALTNFLRFVILLPAMLGFLVLEGCVRLDKFFVKKTQQQVDAAVARTEQNLRGAL